MASRQPPSADDQADPVEDRQSGKGWRRIGLAMMIVGAVVLVLFVGLLISDWVNYQAHPEDSVPYYAYVFARAITIALPGVAVGLLGYFAFWRRPLGAKHVPSD